MQDIFHIVHVLIAVALIGIILIQHGKGADVGAAFGSGASSTVFGSQGSGSFLTRTTAILATLFFISNLVLGYLSSQTRAPESVVKPQETISVPAPEKDKAESELPAVESAIPTDEVPQTESSQSTSELPLVPETTAAETPVETSAEIPTDEALPTPADAGTDTAESGEESEKPQ